MKKLLLLIAVVALTVTACSNSPSETNSQLSIEDILKEYQQPGAGGRSPSSEGSEDEGQGEQPSSNVATCYGKDQHPIGKSIADQFPAVTSYEEVMNWFCNGALFEDILNALATEEITGIEAEAMLRMVAEGFTWDEIWLELGVTEE